jgi:hypothetical protein
MDDVDGIIFIIETLEKKLDTTRRNSFIWTTKNETNRNLCTQKETKLNPFKEPQQIKLMESLLYGPIKNETEINRNK